MHPSFHQPNTLFNYDLKKGKATRICSFMVLANLFFFFFLTILAKLKGSVTILAKGQRGS